MKKYMFISLVIGFAACNQTDNKPVVRKAVEKKYEISEVVQKDLSSTINLPGELGPYEMVELYPKINGFIKAVLVDRGSQVKKGQVLIRLEAPEVEQQYLAAKSKYLQAYSMFIGSKDNYERLVVTSKTAGTVSAHDLTLANSKMLADSATAQSEIANYKGLQATTNYLTVIAPFDGVITQRNVHPGALVGPNIKTDNGPMLVLEQEARLRLVIKIPEVYSNQLENKSVIHFHVSTLPGKTFTGVITRSAGSLDLKYRSEAIEADVINTGHLLKPGMYAEVVLPVKRSEAPLVVPSSAIVNSTEGKYVICLLESKAHKVNIHEGNSQNDSTEVFGDLHAGDKVLVHANDEIKEGVLVKSE